MTRSHIRTALFALTIGTSGVLFHTAARADDPATATPKTAADPSGPEAVFKDKNLNKSGFRLVLPIEADIHGVARALKVAKSKQAVDTSAVKKIDEKIKTAKQTLHDMDTEDAKLNEMMSTAGDRTEQNQIIGKMNALKIQAKQQQELLDGLVADKKKLTEGKEAYVDAVLEGCEKADGAKDAYTDLVSDADLTAAIAKANETTKGSKLVLGPSPSFKEDLDFIAKCKSEITMVVVPVTTEHGVPEVTATVNGKKEQMVWDSGAGMVLLSSTIAAEVGLKPTDKDPILMCKLADGKVVKCRKMSIKTITVGAFTVNDVECAVMPPELTDVESLLGDTFQSHFLVKLDQNGGQLRLTPLDTSTVKQSVIAKPAAAKKDE